jgi:hypothetical protein
MRTLFERLRDGDGLQEFSLEDVNAMLVDAGAYCMSFWGHFIGRFHPDNKEFVARGKVLHHRFVGPLTLKHSHRRDKDDLDWLRKELADG